MAFASFSTPSLLLEEGGVVTISLENREKEKIPCNKRTTKYTTNLFWDGSQPSQPRCEVTSCKSVSHFELWIKIWRISRCWYEKHTSSASVPNKVCKNGCCKIWTMQNLDRTKWIVQAEDKRIRKTDRASLHYKTDLKPLWNFGHYYYTLSSESL